MDNVTAYFEKEHWLKIAKWRRQDRFEATVRKCVWSFVGILAFVVAFVLI